MADTQTENKAPAESTTEGQNGAAPAAEKTKEKDDKPEEKKPKKPFKWTPLKIGLLVGVGVIAIILGTIYYIDASNHETTDDAYTTGHIHNISSRVTGTVIAVLVDDNQFVKKGQVLVKLDPRDYQVNVDQARANFISTKLNYDRMNSVKGDGAISQESYDQSKASITGDQAALTGALDQLSYCTICAPTDGYVGAKAVEIGNRVEVGGLLMDVMQDAWVLGNFKETQLGSMVPGQRATITVDAIPSHKFLGWIDSFSPGSGTVFALLPSDNATGNFTKIVQRVPVKIVFDPASAKGYEGRLVPGLSVEVSVDLQSVPKGKAPPQNQQIQDDQNLHIEANTTHP
jgi:membrane fusion protein (multidrug efflux system)